MDKKIDLQNSGPKDPVTDPDVDDPHPVEPEPEGDPAEHPNPYPVTDPNPPYDPDTEPVREPDPSPTFPEPIPGEPPNVYF